MLPRDIKGAKMDQTKMRFARALRDLMNEKPLAKISVGEIAERAELSRKAFYNHFLDKNDLLNWIVYSQFVQLQKDQLEDGGWEAFRSFLEFFATDRAFFADALRDMSQNSLGQYFSDLLFEVVHASAAKGFKHTIRSEKWVGLATAALVEDARKAIIVWLTDDPDMSARELLDMLVSATDAFCAMSCIDRATKSGVQLCDYAIDTLAANWSSEPSEEDMDLPRPNNGIARRQQYAWVLDRCL